VGQPEGLLGGDERLPVSPEQSQQFSLLAERRGASTAAKFLQP